MTPETTRPETRPNEAMATVLSCTYEAGMGQALAFGIPATKHFHIRFNYWANNELHEGEFLAAKPLPQGTLFPITYNPEAPHEHSRASEMPLTRSPLLAVGMIGSVLVSLVWLIILRGCY